MTYFLLLLWGIMGIVFNVEKIETKLKVKMITCLTFLGIAVIVW